MLKQNPPYPPLEKGGIGPKRGTRDCLSFFNSCYQKTHHPMNCNQTNLKKRFYVLIIQQNFRCLSPKNIVKWLRPWKIPLTSIGMTCQPRRTPPLERLPRSQIFLDTRAGPVLQECEIRSSVPDGEFQIHWTRSQLALYPVPRRRGERGSV